MKMLLISDIHHGNDKHGKSRSEEMISRIKKAIDIANLDVIVFAGDLANKNGMPYKEAYDSIFDELVDRKEKKIIITCGNHDICRKLIKPMFSDYIGKFKTNEELNDFVERDESNQFSENLGQIDQYFAFVRDCIKPRITTPMYYIDEVIEGKKKIGFVSINTAWLSLGGRDEYGKVIFPSTYIRDCIKEIKDCDIKILITHYPISYFSEYNKSEIAKMVFTNFDILLSGHAHRTDKGVLYYSEEGIFSCSAPCCISLDGDQNKGFIYIDYNWDDMSANIREYRSIDDKYVAINELPLDLPVAAEKKDAININKAIAEKRLQCIEYANRRFGIHQGQELDFLERFNNPVLKDYEKYAAIKKLSIHNATDRSEKEYTISDLMNDNSYVIRGEEKSGKTMLLYRVYIEYLSLHLSKGYFPLYIDMRHVYKFEQNEFSTDVSEWLRREYRISSHLVEIAKSKNVVLLIDNYDSQYADANAKLLKLTDKCKFIISMTQHLNPSPVPRIDDLSYINLYIHDISRKQIRELTEKWPKIKEKKDDVIAKVTSIFTQLNINFNYWTVSLFLWIFEKTADVNIHNNIELIDLYIENMLEKTQLTLDMNKQFSYENYKDFLSELAHYLYDKCANTEYSAPYSKLIEVYEEFKEKNIRIIADSKIIIDYVIDKGVIIKIAQDYYTFRLNGVFEYFLAHYMKRSSSFLDTILSDTEMFLSFKNELEIYAGLNRNDSDTLLKIYCNALSANDLYFKKNEAYSKISLADFRTKGANKELLGILEKSSSEAKPLEKKEKDNLEDSISPINDIQSEVHLKHKYNIERIDTTGLYDHIYLLGRVFRSMDDIGDQKLVEEIFSFIFGKANLMPQYMKNDLAKIMEGEKGKEYKIIEAVLDEFSPILSQSFLYETLAHVNLEKIIRKEIERYSIESGFEYELFVLAFMIIDNDIESKLDMLEKLIEKCNKNAYITSSAMMKVIMYIVLKCNSKDLETKLRAKLLQMNKIVNPKDKDARLLQHLDKIKLKENSCNN